ncbi:alanine racemase [Patescibacteria group bacterium]|nr:alanine racemase [Patescibacteria group bacterium]
MKTWIELSAYALRHNYRQVANLVAPAQVMAVLKADAYGHGLLQVAEALKADAALYGVDRLEEGIQLRQAGFESQIVILGFTEANDVRRAREYRLDLAISSLEALEQLHFTTQEKGETLRIHLEIETGLYRLGIPPEDYPRTITFLQAHSDSIQVQGLFTHFANVEEELDKGFPVLQEQRFQSAVQTFTDAGIRPPQLHMACSAAGLVFGASHFNLVRLGISLYGLWSSELVEERSRTRTDVKIVLEPVLSWKTKIAQVKSVAANETVGYGKTQTLTRASKIAILPIGYYDGYPRALSSVGNVLIRNRLCPIVGRICMNMCMVDVTDVPQATAGDEVTLIGLGIPAETVAALAGTLHYELIARLSASIPRRLVA